MKRNEFVVAVTVVTLTALSLIVFQSIAAPMQTKTISNVGLMKAVGVGIYSDQACVNAVSSIDWGIISQSSNVNKTVYIRNEGNVAATLAMLTLNWNPSNSPSYITLRWNYAGQILSKDQVIQVTFILSVSANITGITDFSFDITVTANG